MRKSIDEKVEIALHMSIPLNKQTDNVNSRVASRLMITITQARQCEN